MDIVPVVVKFTLEPGAQAPEQTSDNAACFDVRAYLPDSPDGMSLWPGRTVMISTGLRVEIPVGYEIQVRSRSGLAAKHEVSVTNSPGTIDADYRGIVGVILTNHSQRTSIVINHGDRIAQLAVREVTPAIFQQTDALSETARGEGGFGSSGLK
jgi:dUTP pyrophosphatase